MIDSLNYLEIAHILEDNGASAIAVHGRTKRQAYGGEARWEPIGEVKASVKIPVIGNGDVKCVADIDRMRAQTRCDAVMIGRAAIGNPWIFRRQDRAEVTFEERAGSDPSSSGRHARLLRPRKRPDTFPQARGEVH